MAEASTQNWREVALAARKALDQSLPHGQKSERLARIAEGLNVTRGTLDNYLSALACLARLESLDATLSERLVGQSATAIASMGRWADYDQEGLLKFLEEHPRPRLRQVLDAEKQARHQKGRVAANPFDQALADLRAGPPPNGNSGQRLRPHGYLEGVLSSFGLPSVTPLQLDWDGEVPAYANALGLSRIGRLLDKRLSGQRYGHTRFPAWSEEPGIPVMGVIEVGARALEEHYRREARALWNRMVASATLVPLVIVLFPDDVARKATAGNFSPPPELWRNLMLGPQPKWVRTLNPWNAAALLTTPATLGSDYAGADEEQSP